MRRILAIVILAVLAGTAFATPEKKEAPEHKDDEPKEPKEPTPKKDESKPTSPNAGRKVVVERVVAIVNDSIILASELEARMVPMRAEAMQIADAKERERRLAKLQTQVLDEMVNEELIVQAGEAAKIEVEASEVQAALDEIKSQNSLDDAGLAQVLAAQGFTLANYRTELRRQLMRLRAQNQLVAPKVQVTEEDVRARYDQMQRRSEAVSAVNLSHMLFKLPEHATEQQLTEAKAKAAKAIQRVKAGEEFATVAAEVSEDTGTSTTGGQLGWFQRGSINPEWEQIVFAMEKGDLRGPVTGPQGLHVFFVNEVKKSELKSYDQMKEPLSRELRRRETEKKTQEWLEELRKKAYIDIKVR
ncbi:MAG: peptidylprolyl isomerase [Deltaproteobacteria bacterium]|nr:peptidylprolyl isomerase [Deltaproteobacteria bacterium]